MVGEECVQNEHEEKHEEANQEEDQRAVDKDEAVDQIRAEELAHFVPGNCQQKRDSKETSHRGQYETKE